MIRIFIVADTSDRAAALSRLLEEDEHFEVAELALADVVLCAGISLQRLPVRGKPVVAISNDNDSDAPFDDTLKAWLPASVKLEEMSAALSAAAAGLTVLTRQQAQRTFRTKSGPAEDLLQMEDLTAREGEVLQMMAAGFGNKEIAARLRISPNTAKFHVRQILAKLGAESRTEAVSIGMRRGLIAI